MMTTAIPASPRSPRSSSFRRLFHRQSSSPSTSPRPRSTAKLYDDGEDDDERSILPHASSSNLFPEKRRSSSDHLMKRDGDELAPNEETQERVAKRDEAEQRQKHDRPAVPAAKWWSRYENQSVRGARRRSASPPQQSTTGLQGASPPPPPVLMAWPAGLLMASARPSTVHQASRREPQHVKTAKFRSSIEEDEEQHSLISRSNTIKAAR